MAGREGPPGELEIPRHSTDFIWRSFPFSVHIHCWFWLVPLHKPKNTLLFSKRHSCFWIWTIWNPSGRWKAHIVLCNKLQGPIRKQNNPSTNQPSKNMRFTYLLLLLCQMNIPRFNICDLKSQGWQCKNVKMSHLAPFLLLSHCLGKKTHPHWNNERKREKNKTI